MVRMWVFIGSMMVVLNMTVLAMDEAPRTPQSKSRAAVTAAALTLSVSPRARQMMGKSPTGRYTSWANEGEVTDWFRRRPHLARYALRQGEFDLAIESGLLQQFQQLVIDVHSLYQEEGMRDFGDFGAELESLRDQIGSFGERKRLTVQAEDFSQEKESGCACC
ncbi:hypothetical protein JW872_03575 [Candidatus Babeliales bacterium]|nr:hypothetical protein [Candidatus Babeliales bacterium]